MRCYFEDRDAGPCDGRIIKAHLVPRQLLKREFPHGAVLDPCEGRDFAWRTMRRDEDPHDFSGYRSLDKLINDPRTWVPCCGGPMGNAGHHGAVDVSKRVRLTREEIPAAVDDFCAEMGLLWYLDRTFGREPVTNGSRPLNGDA